MSRQILLFTIHVFFITLISCSSREVTNEVIIKDTVSVVVKDTIYITKDPIISNDLYFSINNIYNGGYWEKENDNNYYFYYRLLFTSIEEIYYIYVEEVKIISDSKVELVKRMEIVPKIFGQEYYHEPPEVIDWVSSTVIELLINGEKYNLNLSKMKVVK
jgi:hypothetical protein